MMIKPSIQLQEHPANDQQSMSMDQSDGNGTFKSPDVQKLQFVNTKLEENSKKLEVELANAFQVIAQMQNYLVTSRQTLQSMQEDSKNLEIQTLKGKLLELEKEKCVSNEKIKHLSLLLTGRCEANYALEKKNEQLQTMCTGLENERKKLILQFNTLIQERNETNYKVSQLLVDINELYSKAEGSSTVTIDFQKSIQKLKQEKHQYFRHAVKMEKRQTQALLDKLALKYQLLKFEDEVLEKFQQWSDDVESAVLDRLVHVESKAMMIENLTKESGKLSNKDNRSQEEFLDLKKKVEERDTKISELEALISDLEKENNKYKVIWKDFGPIEPVLVEKLNSVSLLKITEFVEEIDKNNELIKAIRIQTSALDKQKSQRQKSISTLKNRLTDKSLSVGERNSLTKQLENFQVELDRIAEKKVPLRKEDGKHQSRNYFLKKQVNEWKDSKLADELIEILLELRRKTEKVLTVNTENNCQKRSKTTEELHVVNDKVGKHDVATQWAPSVSQKNAQEFDRKSSASIVSQINGAGTLPNGTLQGCSLHQLRIEEESPLPQIYLFDYNGPPRTLTFRADCRQIRVGEIRAALNSVISGRSIRLYTAFCTAQKDNQKIVQVLQFKNNRHEIAFSRLNGSLFENEKFGVKKERKLDCDEERLFVPPGQVLWISMR